MQTKIPNFEELRKENSELPKWVVVLMRAYEEYLEGKKTKPEAVNGKPK